MHISQPQSRYSRRLRIQTCWRFRFVSEESSQVFNCVVKLTFLPINVSDREWVAHDPHTARRLAAAASAVCADLPQSVVFWSDWDGAPVTATRTLALAAKGGDDDMFSSDLTDSELRRALAPVSGVPTLVLASGADEYVPRAVDIDALAGRIAGAVVPRGGGEAVVIDGAPHSGAGKEGEIVDAVLDFIERRCQP